jgi:hypothetical protein
MQVNITIHIDDRIIRLARWVTSRRAAIAVGSLLLVASAFAVAVPNEFMNGQTIDAARMNENFSALEASSWSGVGPTRTFDGNVGIGTTPARKLHVLDAGALFARLEGGSAAALELKDGDSVTNYRAWRLVADLNRLSIQRATDDFATTTGDVLVMAGSNVGIGTSTPQGQLHATGNIRSDGFLYSSDTTRGLVLKAPGGACFRISVADTGDPVTSPVGCP